MQGQAGADKAPPEAATDASRFSIRLTGVSVTAEVEEDLKSLQSLLQAQQPALSVSFADAHRHALMRGIDALKREAAAATASTVPPPLPAAGPAPANARRPKKKSKRGS